MKSWLALATICLLPTSAGAYVADGHEYKLSCNADGYQLKSVYPISRTVGSGAGSKIEKGIEVLFLGRSCDASHRLFGQGKWCWANGGFIAEFASHRFGFGRQELFCKDNVDPEYSGSCRC